jgi:acyl-CoA thioesterase YciA
MEFRSRRLVKYEDLNPRGTLFGGQLLKFIDEEASIFVMCQLGTEQVVTKCMSEINFVSPGHLGDVIEIGVDLVEFGTTSITVKCEVRNKTTKQTIISIEKIVFVCVDKNGKPLPHGITKKSVN